MKQPSSTTIKAPLTLVGVSAIVNNEFIITPKPGLNKRAKKDTTTTKKKRLKNTIK